MLMTERDAHGPRAYSWSFRRCDDLTSIAGQTHSLDLYGLDSRRAEPSLLRPAAINAYAPTMKVESPIG
jgi:hypothetical protein